MKIFSALLFSILIYSNINGQQLSIENKPALNEESKSVDSWVAHLDQDMSYCISTYSEFMRKNFDYRVSRRSKNVHSVDKKMFSEISSLRIDQRAVFTQESKGTAVAFQFSPGYDIHFGNTMYKEEFDRARALVVNYVHFHYKMFYDDQIKSLRSKIKGLEKNISNNQSKTEKNNKAISLNTEDISNNAVGADKLREKNEKLEKENVSLAAEVDKFRTQITQLETEIDNANQSLKLVEAFN
ncbi:MAG TPA: hypothetical protein PKM40_03560 [Bacteroidia bacterium]|nr:hypothetical protein [Bacteroidia bacterium]